MQILQKQISYQTNIKVLPNVFNNNSVLQHLKKDFQKMIMPSKDTAVDRLHVSSNQRKQTVLTSYTSTEKMFLLQCKQKYWKKENNILKFHGHRSSHLE